MLKAFRLGLRLKSAGQSFFFVGVIFLGIFSFGWGTVNGSYEGMAQRELARSPQFATESATDSSYKPYESLLDLKWIPSWGEDLAHGYFLAPASLNAPKPPGMKKWISPGEALLSPSLTHKYPVGSISPWGIVVSEIPISALSNPTELFFYARPEGPLPADWGRPVINFSGNALPVNGDQLNLLPLIYVKLFLVLFLALPGLISLGTGLFQAFALRQTNFLIKQIGGSTYQRFFCSAGAMAKPLLAGALTITGLIALACFQQIPLPFVNTVIYPPDVKTQLVSIIILVIGTWFFSSIAAGINGVLIFADTQSSKTWRNTLLKLSQLLVIPGLLFVWVFVSVQGLRGLSLQLVFLGAAISLSLAIPTASIWLAQLCASLLNKVSDSATAVIVKRKLWTHSSSLIISMLGISFILVFLGAFQLYALQLSNPMKQALVTQKVLGKTVLHIDVKDFSNTEIDVFRNDLKKLGTTVLTAAPEGEKGETLIQADKKALHLLGLPNLTDTSINLLNLNPRSAHIVQSMGPEVKLTSNRPIDFHPDSIYLMSERPLDYARVASLASSRGTVVAAIANNWLGGARLLSEKVNWFILLGVPAAFVLILSSIAASYRHASNRLRLDELSQILSLSKWALLQITCLIVLVPTVFTAILSYTSYLTLSTGFAAHSFGFVNSSHSFGIMLLSAGLISGLYLTGLIFKQSLTPTRS